MRDEQHEEQAPSPADAEPAAGRPESLPRRTLLASGAMLAAVAASYGTFAAMAARFLYPARRRPTSWLFVAEAAKLQSGESFRYVTPTGAPVVIARQGSAGTSDDFIALSSTCPHLGCQVHWEASNNRFFCPCHNGTFDPQGRATGGPPFKAGQSLPRYPLKLEAGLLFLETPVDRIAGGGQAAMTPGACAGCPRSSRREG